MLRPHSTLMVNISNHIRNGQEMPVVEWHIETLKALGFLLRKDEKIVTPRNRYGANSEARVGHEHFADLRAMAPR